VKFSLFNRSKSPIRFFLFTLHLKSNRDMKKIQWVVNFIRFDSIRTKTFELITKYVSGSI
jgi:hypothetical protein